MGGYSFMKILSLNSQYKTNIFNPSYGTTKSDWKIQKTENGIFIPPLLDFIRCVACKFNI